jgi:hypothetical protein
MKGAVKPGFVDVVFRMPGRFTGAVELFVALIVLLAPGLSFGGLITDPVQFQATTQIPAVFPFGPQTAIVTDPGVEFTWSPVSSIFGITSTVQVDFHNDSADFIFSVDKSNITHTGLTTLSFVDQNPNTLITNVTVAKNFSVEFYANNLFTINLTGPHSFDLEFTRLAFGTLSNNPSSDTLTLSIATQNQAVAVPEPTSLALFGMVIGCAAGYAGWRRRKQPMPA